MVPLKSETIAIAQMGLECCMHYPEKACREKYSTLSKGVCRLTAHGEELCSIRRIKEH
jgi:hypothetical protein